MSDKKSVDVGTLEKPEWPWPYIFAGVAGIVALTLVIVADRAAYFLYHPNLVPALSAVSVPLIALLGLIIAHRQAQTAIQQRQIAKTNLRLALFDRRFRIYDSTQHFIQSILTTGKVKADEKFSFWAKVQEARWLLNDDIHHYLEVTLMQKVALLEETDAELDESVGSGDSDTRKRLVVRRRELRDWLGSQNSYLDTAFGPFLRFRIER